MVGSRLPEGIDALHPVIAGERVHQGLIEAVPHVQRAGDVGRRQQDAEGLLFGAGGIKAGGKEIASFPFRVATGFDGRRFVTLVQFHDCKGERKY